MSSDLGPVGEVDAAEWRHYLGLADAEKPIAVVVEGTWWREERTRSRLALLESPRELGVPDLFMGGWAGNQVLYACPYGAPRTAEIVHIAALVGVELAVQIGSCGVLGASVRPGDVVVPTAVLGLDGVTGHYASDTVVEAAAEPAARAAAALEARDIVAHRGLSVTWPTLFNQPVATAAEWSREGYLGVDMEAATTLAVARRFDVDAVAMLVAWDEVLSGRSFLDPLPDGQAAAFKRAEDELFTVALGLIRGR